LPEREAPGMTSRRGFGKLRQLPSGRWQASYLGDDERYHTAPTTFDRKKTAETWLSGVQTDLLRGQWEPPKPKTKPLTFSEHADRWLANRKLKPRTRAHYRSLLDDKIVPTFGSHPLRSITSDDIDAWYARLDASKPTSRSHAHGLMRTIMGDAVQRRL